MSILYNKQARNCLNDPERKADPEDAGGAEVGEHHFPRCGHQDVGCCFHHSRQQTADAGAGAAGTARGVRVCSRACINATEIPCVRARVRLSELLAGKRRPVFEL